MFVVDATLVLAHPTHVVARVVERLHVLPRWCAGLRRVRHSVHDPAAVRAGCVFSYVAAGVRCALLARTLARGPGEPVRHVAEGDGVCLTWTLEVHPDASSPPGAAGLPGVAPAFTSSRLRLRTALAIDPDHPVAAVRTTMCRQLARRAPADLERLRVLLGRYEHGKPSGGPASFPASIPPTTGPRTRAPH